MHNAIIVGMWIVHSCISLLLVLQVMVPEAWPDVLHTLAAFLCPFKAMQQRLSLDQNAAATTGGAAPSAAATDEGAAATGAAAAAAKPIPGSPSGILRGLARCAQPGNKAAAFLQHQCGPFRLLLSCSFLALVVRWRSCLCSSLYRYISACDQSPGRERANMNRC